LYSAMSCQRLPEYISFLRRASGAREYCLTLALIGKSISIARHHAEHVSR
jgi:hypothetical protein